MKKSLRFVFIGKNGRFSLSPLRALAKHHELLAVIESAPRNFKNQFSFSEKVKRKFYLLQGRDSLPVFAKEVKVPYFFLSRDNIKELKFFLRELNPDIGCIASMSQLLPKSVFSIPRHGFVNFHPSLLPKYRGPNPWFWMYHEMETEGGVTIHYIDKGEDTGDIILQESYPIPLGMPFKDMQDIAVKIGGKLMVEALDQIATGTANPVAHKYIKTSPRARNVKADEEFISWNQWHVERIYHFLKGTQNWVRFPPPLSWGQSWEIISYEPVSETNVRFGELCKDQTGYYLACKDGKVRLSSHFSMKSILKGLYQS